MPVLFPRHLVDDLARIAFDESDEYVLITDPDGVIRYANPALLACTAYAMEELEGTSITMLGVTEQEGDIFRNTKKSGEVYYTRQKKSSLYDEEGKVSAWIYRFRDCSTEMLLRSENERMETELRLLNQHLPQLVEEHTLDLRLKNEELYKNKLFLEKINEVLPAVIYLMDVATGRVTLLNHKIPESIKGVFLKELILTKELLIRGIHPDDLEEMEAFIENVKKNTLPGTAEIEYRAKGPNGKYRWLLSRSATYEFDPVSHLPLKTVWFVFDVNHRKQNELRVRQNKQMLSSILDNASALIIKFNDIACTQVSFMNSFATGLTGYHEADFISGEKSWTDLLTPAYAELLGRTVRAAVEKNETYTLQYPILTKSGEEKWVEEKGKGVFDENGTLNYVEVFIQDITGKKINEDKLRKSEERLEEAQRIAHIGNWNWDMASDELFWSDEIYRIFGLEKEKFTPSYSTFLECIHPADRRHVEVHVASSLEAWDKYDVEYRIVLPNGTIRYIKERGGNYYDVHGQLERIVGTAQDVTDQKLLQEKYNAAYLTLENSINAVFNTDTEGNMTYVNKAAAKLWGYDNPEKMLKEKPNVRDYWDERSNPYAHEIFESIREKGYYVGIEGVPVQRRDGSLFHTLISGSVMKNEQGQVIGYLGVFFDITEKVKIETALRQYDEQLRFIFANIDEVVYTVDISNGEYMDGKLTFLSEIPDHIAGLPVEIVLNNPEKRRNMVHPDDRAYLEQLTHKMISEKISVTRIYRALDGNTGNYLWMEDKTVPYYNSEGKPIAYYGAARDISARIHHEQALKESVEKYRSLFENALVGMFRVDYTTGLIFEANSIFMELFGYDPGELAQQESLIYDHFLQRENFDLLKENLSEDKHLRNRVALVKDREGKALWAEFSLYYNECKNEIEGVVIDITTRLLYEKKLEENIREKETLLKELHHRVKNNLQIVSGLIELQINKASSPHVKAPLHESRERIMAIALVHEKMYQSADINNIDFAEYLRELISSIGLLYHSDRIATRLRFSPYTLTIEKAIPLGLIAHEIFSNCFKHAFKKKKTGTITAAMSRKNKSGDLLLSFEDDGDGFHVQEAEKANSLGWKLIHSLARQAKVKITVTSAPGTGSRIEILIQTKP